MQVEASKGAGGQAAATQVEMDEKTASTRLMTTRERIARDKKLAALRLHTVEHLPRDVLVEVVQVPSPLSPHRYR